MGRQRDPWFIEASPFDADRLRGVPGVRVRPPGAAATAEAEGVSSCRTCRCPQGLGAGRLDDRLSLLEPIDRQRRDLDDRPAVADFDRFRQTARLAADRSASAAGLRRGASRPKALDRYGRNAFGWSLLMARRLVEAGVNLVQVNLGNNETWDTHGNAFPHLKDKLLPPTDRAVSALLDDLQRQRPARQHADRDGRRVRPHADRFPTLPQYYKLPGRDHWGAVQTVFFAGGGVRGGTVVGSSDQNGGYPAD